MKHDFLLIKYYIYKIKNKINKKRKKGIDRFIY